MTVAELPFDLVQAKPGAPSIRPGIVAKTDVIQRLRTSRLPFATVIAPAGYGKTTLLAGLAEKDPRPFAWVALDGRDDDDVLFLRYIAAAIHRVEPLAPEVFAALSWPGASIWSTGVPRVGSALATLQRPLVLVLDDLHAVENPSCLDVLAALCDYVPSGSQLVIASREEPALPLARWRTQGWLHEIGVADLRLDEQEADGLLRGVGVELDAAEVADLTEQTEGWPACTWPRCRCRPGRQAPRVPCDALLQTTRSARTLQSLERSNRFVVPLDRRGEWYRYHHLFGQLLRNELERSEPEAVAVLSRRAMAWCLANDLPEAAVGYGHAAGETAIVAGLVDRLTFPLYYDGRMATVEEWLGWFDHDELVRYPALAVYGAWLRALTGRPAEAQRWLSLADGATSIIPLSDGSATIAPWVANLRAYMMVDGVERALADAHLALEQFASGSPWRPVALLIRGVARALLGATDQARADLDAAVDTALAMGAFDDAFVAAAELALLAAHQGAWDEAGRHARQAQALVEETGLGDYGTSAIAHVVVARVAVHEGRHADARAALTRAHRLRPLLDHGFPWLTIQVGLELTRAHLALGEAAAARTVLTETDRVLERRPDVGSLAEEVRELRERVAATSGPAGSWAMSLTGAELRLLPYLATHLTFVEIGQRLYLSQNTVKTEANSIYRKLQASSRSTAIERAVQVGLLESTIYPPGPRHLKA